MPKSDDFRLPTELHSKPRGLDPRLPHQPKYAGCGEHQVCESLLESDIAWTAMELNFYLQCQFRNLVPWYSSDKAGQT
jgi:hypothetical protein